MSKHETRTPIDPADLRIAPGMRPMHDTAPVRSPMSPSPAPAAPREHTKRTVLVVLLILLAAVAVWLLLWLFACNGSSLFDPNAQTGQAPYKTDAEIQAELDRVV